ncbi:MAG TPA: hypothetical protein VGG06_31930 [Thermoanaerobaculia bacterium]
MADVRWADAESVFVAAQRIGVHRLTLRDPAVAELIEAKSRARGKTSWQLKRLRSGGAVDACDVPLTVDSELAHLRGDVRDGEVVLLLLYKGYIQKTPHPPAHPELIRLRYEP